MHKSPLYDIKEQEKEIFIMSTKIICETEQRGIHSFFAVVNNKRYFLFNQDFRQGVHEYFESGVCLNEAINHGKAHNDSAIIRTMSKLPMYIRYIEKEYNIVVFDKRAAKRRFPSKGVA